MSRTSGAKKNKSIPNITALRNELDYGHNHNDRDIRFYRAVKAYVSSYKTRTGVSGESFHQKRDPFHQGGLGEMTQDFLFRDGNGARYWPDDEKSENRGSLCFSKDSARIQRAMKSLFFRINQQRYWGRQRSSGQPDSERGASADQPIDVDSLPDPNTKSLHQQDEVPPPTRVVKQEQRAPGVTDEEFEQSTFQYVQSFIDGLPDPGSSTINSSAPVVDPYDVPSSPKTSSSKIPNNGKRPAHFDPTENSAPSKRTKSQEANTSSYPPCSSASHHVDMSAQAPDKPGMPSSRVRKRREFPDMVCFEDVDLTDSEVMDTVESDIINSLPTSPHHAPIAVMHRQDTVEIARTRPEETVQEPSMTMPPPPPPPPRPVPLDAFLQNHHRAQSESVSEPDIPLRAEQTLRRRLGSKVGATHHKPHLGSVAHEGKAPSSAFLASRLRLAATLPSALCPSPAPQATFPRSIDPPSSVPSSVPDISSRERSEESSEPKSNLKASSTPKINLKFSVQISRRICKLWDMKGAFQQKTLSELVDEFNIEESFTGFSLLLETPNMSFDDSVDLGDEEGFQAIKKRFQRKIRDVRRPHKGCGDDSGPAFEISIVPLWMNEPEDEEEPVF